MIRHRNARFSIFRYPLRWAPTAFMLMGFQGLLRDKSIPAGDVRLMGCGGRDGFSIVPDFNRYCVLSALDDPDAQPRLEATRLWRLVAGPSIEQLHIDLIPARGHGTWDGVVPFRYSGRAVGERPFAVLTHARVNRGRTGAFWRSVPEIRRSLNDAQGCAYHIGFGEHPFLTLATFSIWEDLPAMQAFAYRHTPHQRANRAARAEAWLAESLFVRFEIASIDGDLNQHPRLLQLAEAGRIPA